LGKGRPENKEEEEKDGLFVNFCFHQAAENWSNYFPTGTYSLHRLDKNRQKGNETLHSGI
jgi:hypothetical protein